MRIINWVALLSLSSMALCCRNDLKSYENLLIENIEVFEATAKEMSLKYSNRNGTVFPSLKNYSQGDFLYDSSVSSFCRKFSIAYIEVFKFSSVQTDAVAVSFVLQNDNVRYGYYPFRKHREAYFENTRTTSISLNERWQLEMEKKQW